MGEAKRRRAEVEGLKRASREEAGLWRQAQSDEKRVVRGIDPKSKDPEPTAAMARRLHALFETAKQAGDIDPPVKFLHDKVERTIADFGETFGGVPLACKKGCSHCCRVWISATAPEVLFISKIVRSRGGAIIDRLTATHAQTQGHDFISRGRHPYPCPMLEQDICSIYEARPQTCRLGVSGDAQICARVFRDFSNEMIPTPHVFLMGKTAYSIAMAMALKRSNLPHEGYELNAALVRALETDDAERAWLGGQDIFSGVMRDPVDILANGRDAQMLFQRAFG
jgi:hypothetical protein